MRGKQSGEKPPSERSRVTLTDGPVVSSLWSFALPTMAATALQSINGSINTIWIGHLIGKEGLAAASNVNIIISMSHAMTFGFGMAVAILIARAAGAGDVDGLRRSFGAGVGLFSVSGLILTLLGLLGLPSLLSVLDTPADAVPQALEYAYMSFAGLLPALLFTFLQIALRGAGDAHTPLLFIIPVALIDAALNPLLILGAGPFPEMGIAGSALASFISSSAGLAMIIAWIYARDLPIRLRGLELHNLVPAPRLALAIMRQGIPMGLQMIMMSISSLVMLVFVNGEGTATVAAYAAVTLLWGYVQTPAAVHAVHHPFHQREPEGAERENGRARQHQCRHMGKRDPVKRLPPHHTQDTRAHPGARHQPERAFHEIVDPGAHPAAHMRAPHGQRGQRAGGEDGHRQLVIRPAEGHPIFPGQQP